MGNTQDYASNRNYGEDNGESSEANRNGKEKSTAKQNTVGKEAVAGAVRVNYGNPKSMGSRFSRLEVIDEMDGLEMETDEREEADKEGDSNRSNGAGGEAGKGKQAVNSGKSNALVDRAILKASHPTLTTGSNAINAYKNPSGKGGGIERKEIALKDIMNKISLGARRA